MVLAAITFAAETLIDVAPEEVKNPILPVVSEMLWATVAFVALWMLMKYVLLPPVMKGLEDRAEKIRTDLAAAEAATTQAAQAVDEYETSLTSTRVDAVRVVEVARAEAEADRRAKVAGAEAEAAALRAQSAQEVAEAKVRAKAEMQASIAGIAVGAAEAVVQKPLDRAAQTQVIEDYVNRSGSQN